jgi:hypothetical protein
MKKTLLTFILLLIQIGNCESVGNFALASQSQAERLAYQDINELQGFESRAAINEKEWDEKDGDQKAEQKPSRSVAGKVAKVFGITLLSVAGAYAVLFAGLLMIGPTKC